MTFWRNVLPNILLQGQNAVLVVKKTPQNFYQWTVQKCCFLSEKENVCRQLFSLLDQNILEQSSHVLVHENDQLECSSRKQQEHDF